MGALTELMTRVLYIIILTIVSLFALKTFQFLASIHFLLVFAIFILMGAFSWHYTWFLVEIPITLLFHEAWAFSFDKSTPVYDSLIAVETGNMRAGVGQIGWFDVIIVNTIRIWPTLCNIELFAALHLCFTFIMLFFMCAHTWLRARLFCKINSTVRFGRTLCLCSQISANSYKLHILIESF